LAFIYHLACVGACALWVERTVASLHFALIEKYETLVFEIPDQFLTLELKQVLARSHRAFFVALPLLASKDVCSRRASFRRADAAQVGNDAGFVTAVGVIECSSATAARRIVSERW
jgi:hypothetical protein